MKKKKQKTCDHNWQNQIPIWVKMGAIGYSKKPNIALSVKPEIPTFMIVAVNEFCSKCEEQRIRIKKRSFIKII